MATTMGFSALDGRWAPPARLIGCGALPDEVEKLSLEQVGARPHHESGLLGGFGNLAELRVVSGTRNDARRNGERAALALALYIARRIAQREIGALVAVLGGLDMLVFTAGVGEHNAFIPRAHLCGAGFSGHCPGYRRQRRHAATISMTTVRSPWRVGPPMKSG